MLTFIAHVFDDDIAGTTAAWYTSTDFNDRLASADVLLLHTVTTGVSGTSPTLTCQVEHSANGEDWLPAGAGPQIGPIAISNDGTYGGSIDGIDSNPLLGLVRVKITLGGTSPACRLKLHVAGYEWIVSEEARAEAERIGWPAHPGGAKEDVGHPGGKGCGCEQGKH